MCNCSAKGYPHDPRKCTPEQIRKCHGDVEVHPCEENGDCEKDADEAEKKSGK